MKHNKRDNGGREVTDQSPIYIRDYTMKDLKRAPENERAPGLRRKVGTPLSRDSKSSSQLSLEQSELQEDYQGM